MMKACDLSATVIASTVIVTTMLMIGCDKKSQYPISNQPTLVGCYSVDKGVPAQIKINETNGLFTMQMKEQIGGWDTPESLDVLSGSKAWAYFSGNTLGVRESGVGQVLARPDGVMAMGIIKDSAAALNPQVDSPFLMTILGATNTVYNVPCDDEPVFYDTTISGHIINANPAPNVQDTQGQITK